MLMEMNWNNTQLHYLIGCDLKKSTSTLTVNPLILNNDKIPNKKGIKHKDITMIFPISINYKLYIEEIIFEELEKEKINELKQILKTEHIDTFSDYLAEYWEEYEDEDEYLDKFGSEDIRYNMHYLDMVSENPNHEGIVGFLAKNRDGIITYFDHEIIEEYIQLEINFNN